MQTVSVSSDEQMLWVIWQMVDNESEQYDLAVNP